MKTRHRNTFTTIRTEGAILPPDLLLRISEGDKDLNGLQPKDYHLLKNEKLNEAINRSWNRLIGAWESFQDAQEKVMEGQAGTTETRERWLLPLFQELGYGRLQTSTAVTLNRKTYPISHMWERAPIHLLGFNVVIDKRTPGIAGAAQTSPHSMLQEFLNRSDDHLWGFLSNGLILRILRDNVSLTRQAYVEFDLQAMMEGEVYADFVLLWMLCHQSRVEGEKPEQFCLEQWSREAQEQGTRALDQLRDGVEKAISSLGTGFLVHPANQDLRGKLRDGSLDTQEYYRQLLRLVYRLIFLFVAEDRDLLFPPESDLAAQKHYTEYYSTQRLRRLAERSRGSRHADLYHTLRLVTDKLGSLEGCEELALPALGGFLFSDEATSDLGQAELPNQNLLDAVRALAYTVDIRTLRSMDYKNLGPEELGSVYESLLELHPEINLDAGTFALTSASGHERKTTGSYYTPSSLIQVLLDSALDPVITDRLEKVKGKSTEEQEQALLNIKVCDPASGSGHFLIAAAHRIAKVLAAVRTGDDEPSPEATRTALRDVISHCLYGVDVNPMAVELCKVSLWMEALEPGKPLSFLDAHIKCGNSLVGVGPGMDISEIPDDAFKTSFGDDKLTATNLRKRNKREREGQLGFRWDINLEKEHEDLAQWVVRQSMNLEVMPEDQAHQIQKKNATYQAFINTGDYQRQRLEFDLWTAAFFWQLPKGDAEMMLAPTQQELMRLRMGENLDAEFTRRVQAIANSKRFYHWDLEFPTVFSRVNPGFDVVLGNPPWDMIQINPKEFFQITSPEISNARTTAERNRFIKRTRIEQPELYHLYQNARHENDSEKNFIHQSNRFPLTNFGRLNLMAIFAELAIQMINGKGKSGIIIQTTIATTSFTQHFFQHIVNTQRLDRLIDFENEDFLFKDIANVVRFCLFVVNGKRIKTLDPQFGFLIRKVSQLGERERFYSLSKEDFTKLNPNTLTCPVFRTRTDAELTRKIYNDFPVLINEKSRDNPWDIEFQLMFMMNTDSNLFETSSSNNLIPLYEAKFFWHYDHRFGSYGLEGKKKGGRGLPKVPIENLENPNYSIHPRYWIPKTEVNAKLTDWDKNWLLCFRDISSAKLERTGVFCVIPRRGVSNKAPIIKFRNLLNPHTILCFIANTNSLVFDYTVRQKVGGTSLNFFIVKQFAIIPPSIYSSPKIQFVSFRVLELTYTAWDLQSFAEDMGYEGPPFRYDEVRRALLRAELDAYYAKLYGLNRKQLRYILDPADLTPAELEDILDPREEVNDPLDLDGYSKRVAVSTFPGETFRVLKEKEIKQFGEYRTRQMVLAAWDRLAAVDFNVEDYVPMVDPPPAHPSLAHPNRGGSVYEGPGLVLDIETAIETKAIQSQNDGEKIATREEEIISAEPKVEKTAAGVKSTQTSDYSLYKCKGCSQMVMGFDKENHLSKVHLGNKPGFTKL